MSDLSRYLLQTEVAEVVVRRHWASQCRTLAIYLAVTVVAISGLNVLPNDQVVSVVGGVTLVASAVWFLWRMFDWRSERFVITDKRVLLVNGLLTRRVAIMPLSKVTDLTYERTLGGRLLGYGTFVMESAGHHQAMSRIEYLPIPDQLYKRVSGLLFGARSRFSRLPGDRYDDFGPDRAGYPRRHRELATERFPVADQSTEPLPRLR